MGALRPPGAALGVLAGRAGRHRLLLGLVAALALAAATHDPFADGPTGAYLLQLGRTLLLVTALYVAAQGLRAAGARRDWPLAAMPDWLDVPGLAVALAAALALSTWLQHAVRLLHPVRWGAAYSQFADDFSAPALAEGKWRIVGEGMAFVRREGGQAVIRPPAATTAALEALLPAGATYAGRLPWLPAGLADAPDEEELAWRGRVQLDRQFFVVLEWGPLLLQQTTYGLHVTYPSPGDDRSGFEVHQPLAAAGATQTWRVARTPTQTTLSVDGQMVWSGPAQPLGRSPRFGETHSDAQHGGRLTLEWVRYGRRLAPEAQLGRLVRGPAV